MDGVGHGAARHKLVSSSGLVPILRKNVTARVARHKDLAGTFFAEVLKSLHESGELETYKDVLKCALAVTLRLLFTPH